MPLPLVVVEVPAHDSAAPEVSALIEACTTGLGGGRCELTQNRKRESATAVAIVSWPGGRELSALVEVSRLGEPSEAWRSEELKFQPEDQRRERFRTIGFAIAALFREALPEPSPGDRGPTGPATPSKTTGKPTPVPGPASAPRRRADETIAFRDAAPQEPSARRRAEAWISAGAFASYNPQLGAWHSGGQLKFALGASGFSGFLCAFGSYAVGHAPSGTSLSWSTVGLGPGLRLPLPPRLELRTAARGLMVNISGSASEAARTSRQSVWVPGAGLELELGVQASERFVVTLGGEIQRLAGSVPIREHNQPVGTVGETALGVSLTLELRLLGPANTRR